MNINSLGTLISKLDMVIDFTNEPSEEDLNDYYLLIFFSQIYGENGKYQEAINFGKKAFALAKTDIQQFSAKVAEIYPKVRLNFNTDFTDEFNELNDLIRQIESIQNIEINDHIFFQYFLATYFNFRGIVNYCTSNYVKALKWLKKALNVWEILDDKHGKVQTHVNFTLNLTKLGKINDALEYSNAVLKQIDEKEDPTGKIYGYLSQAKIYELLADYQSAFNYLQLGYNLALKINHNQMIASTARALTRIYWRRGNFDEVENLQKQVLIYYQSMNNAHFLSMIYNDIGNSKLKIKQFYEAQTNFLKSIEEGKKIGLTDELIKSYYYLILTSVESEMLNVDLDNYLREMKSYISSSDNPKNSNYFRLAQALVYKNEKRPHVKFQAIDLLRSIIKDHRVHFEMKIDAIYHLTELLLIEYKFVRTKDIITEIYDILDQLLIISTNINSRPLMIDYYLFYSKLLRALGDKESAIESLEKAVYIAKLGNFPLLHNQIIRELRILKTEKVMLTNLNEISFPNQYEFEDIQKYVKELQRGKKPMISDHLQDKPKMVMIISEGGLNLYAETFQTNIKSELDLVASFIIAIKLFTKEVFAKGSILEKISLGDDDLLVQQLGNIHLLYMYHGYTPSAIDRMTVFTQYLKQNAKVLDKLKRSTIDAQSKSILSELTSIAFS